MAVVAALVTAALVFRAVPVVKGEKGEYLEAPAIALTSALLVGLVTYLLGPAMNHYAKRERRRRRESRRRASAGTVRAERIRREP